MSIDEQSTKQSDILNISYYWIDGQDYISSSKIVNFTSGGSTTKSIPIQIIDDGCSEPTEYFTIEIEPLDGDVTFPLNVAVVAIEDDDGTFCHNYKCIHCKGII